MPVIDLTLRYFDDVIKKLQLLTYDLQQVNKCVIAKATNFTGYHIFSTCLMPLVTLVLIKYISFSVQLLLFYRARMEDCFHLTNHIYFTYKIKTRFCTYFACFSFISYSVPLFRLFFIPSGLVFHR